MRHKLFQHIKILCCRDIEIKNANSKVFPDNTTNYVTYMYLIKIL